ncbi:Crp-like helix-turn-helix domain-containing protein [Streptomyces sp. OV198]|uniref:helix-turn-helix domain-containing protein n=1 Tax=Streptomyces sp. OV198 TaxID=1882787 RepID=UPI000BCA5695|nr:helix-turn-helix domain-containing protein [Streptomyces sp. OV198]SOF02456.1 Crp-like helix-turn-helix domain-containing protein [Streptomyces sp. OV198]
MYSSEDNPNAFALDSLEFFLVISQYFREALPLRLIFLLIACQRAGGRIELTQDEMAKVLDVSRQAVNEALQEIMTHGIVYKRSRGVYQFNPPYSYRIGELVRTLDGGKKYVRVEQDEVRKDTSLPDLVRFPSLDHLRRAVEEMRAERAERRTERKKARQAAEEPTDGLWELPGAAEEGMAQ